MRPSAYNALFSPGYSCCTKKQKTIYSQKIVVSSGIDVSQIESMLFKKIKTGNAMIAESIKDNLDDILARAIIRFSSPAPFAAMIVGVKTVVNVVAKESTNPLT